MPSSKNLNRTTESQLLKFLLSSFVNISFLSATLITDIIPPEISNDEFYFKIMELSKSENIQTILEIGSSSGNGSTEAFVLGMRENPNHPTLFCMEISETRFDNLKKRYEDNPSVSCYRASSVPLNAFPSKQTLASFVATTSSNLPDLSIVYEWLDQDIEYVKNANVPENGIELIKSDNHIEVFDMVLIDGSEFTGAAEFEHIYGAKWILLDDIRSFKNYWNHQRLLSDYSYELIFENPSLRNGYSIFRKITNESNKI